MSTEKSKLIDEYIDMLEHKAGKIHLYQFTVLAISHLVFFDVFLMMGCSPIMEDMPYADMYNKKTGETLLNTQYTKDYCKDENIELIRITQSKNYSISSYFNFYCHDTTNALLNASLFSGIVVAMFVLSACINTLGRKKTMISMLFLNFIVCVLTSLSANTAEVIIGIFFYNVTGMTAGHAGILYSQECVVNSKRSIFSSVVQLGYIPCMVMYYLLLFYTENWKIAFYVNAGISITMMVIIFFALIESPKTFLKNRDYDNYMLTLLEVSKKNGRKDKFLSFLIMNGENYFLNKIYDKDFPHLDKLKQLIDEEDMDLMRENLKERRQHLLNKPRDSLSEGRLAKSERLQRVLEEPQSSDDDEDLDTVRRKSLFTSKHAEIARRAIASVDPEALTRRKYSDRTDTLMDKDGEKFKINFKELREYFGYIDLSKRSFGGDSNNNSFKNPKVKKNYREVNPNEIETSSSPENRVSGKEVGESINNMKKTEIDTNSNGNSNNNEIEEKEERKYTPLDLLRFPSQRYKFLLLGAMWLINCGMYFGNTVNLKNLPGSILIVGLINAGVEGVGYFGSGFVMNSPLGRILSNKIYYVVASICYLLLTVFDMSDGLKIALSFIAKIVLVASINTLFVISGEIYPNTIKSFGYSLNMATGKLGAVIFTAIIELMTDFQVNLMFTIMGVMNFFLFFTVYETRGMPLEAEIPELQDKKQEDEKN